MFAYLTPDEEVPTDQLINTVRGRHDRDLDRDSFNIVSLIAAQCSESGDRLKIDSVIDCMDRQNFPDVCDGIECTIRSYSEASNESIGMAELQKMVYDMFSINAEEAKYVCSAIWRSSKNVCKSN